MLSAGTRGPRRTDLDFRDRDGKSVTNMQEVGHRGRRTYTYRAELPSPRTVTVAGTAASGAPVHGSLSDPRPRSTSPLPARRRAVASALGRAARRGVPPRKRRGVPDPARPLPAAALRLRAPDALVLLAPGRGGRAAGRLRARLRGAAQRQPRDERPRVALPRRS